MEVERYLSRINQQGGMTPNQTVVEMYNKGYGKRSWRYACT